MRILSATVLALAVLAMSGAPAQLQAKPARTQPDPQVFDLTEPSRPTVKSPAQQDCFVEPEGFANQIRWDGECVKARQQRTRSVATTEASKFVAPRGFHNQIRWD